jgi:uncharacterized protein
MMSGKKKDWQYVYEETMKILGKEEGEISRKFQKLCDIIKGYQSGVVAFSAGVDSSLLAFLCHHLLQRNLSVTADSPTLPRRELEGAIVFAQNNQLNHRIISYNELDDERFAKNDSRRCFYCKDGLFSQLEDIRKKEGYNFVIDGSNHDDLDDYRPGREAAERNHVRSPLLEAHLGKSEIRSISKALGLPTADKPQMACLSSRFPKDTPITDEDLKKVEEAEELVKGLGYHDVRVRFYGNLAKIEIGSGEDIDLSKLRSLVPKFKELGFTHVTLDLEGFRSGSMNE